MKGLGVTGHGLKGPWVMDEGSWGEKSWGEGS